MDVNILQFLIHFIERDESTQLSIIKNYEY